METEPSPGDRVTLTWGLDHEVPAAVVDVHGPADRRHAIVALSPERLGDVVKDETAMSASIDVVEEGHLWAPLTADDLPTPDDLAEALAMSEFDPRRVALAVAGAAQFSTLERHERELAHEIVDVLIQARAARATFGQDLLDAGTEIVVLDDDGHVVQRWPDGRVERLDDDGSCE